MANFDAFTNFYAFVNACSSFFSEVALKYLNEIFYFIYFIFAYWCRRPLQTWVVVEVGGGVKCGVSVPGL